MTTIRYSISDLLWHWGQVGLFVVLLGTGASIHWPGLLPGFALATSLHDSASILLLVLIAYGVLRSALRRKVTRPRSRDLLTLALRVGAHKEGEHPLEENGRAPMSAMQKRFYKVALGVILPVTVMSGVLMLIMRRAPLMPGANVVAALHLLAAFVVVAFIILHVYVTTLRRQPFASIKAITSFSRGESKDLVGHGVPAHTK